MTNPFQPKQIQVPGLLSDDAFQEKLKQFSSEKNVQQNAAPAPTSAVEFADRIRNEYLDIPLPTIKGKPMVKNENLQAQDRAIDVRSDILSNIAPDATGTGGQMLRNLILGPVVGTFGEGSLLDKAVEFSPEQRQQEADARLEEAKRQEQAVRDHAATRAKLRGMTDDEATAMGLPVAPGGSRADDAAVNNARDAVAVQSAADSTAEKQKAADTPALQPTMPWWLNSIREGYKAAAGTPLSVAKGGINVWELTAGAVLNAGDLERSDVRAWVDTVEATLDKMMPGDKARSKDFITQLSQGGGSMAAFMLGGYVGAAVGLPASTVPAIMGALSQGNEGLEDAEQFNAVGVQKYLAFILNAGLGLTEAAPIDRMFMGAEKATGGLVSRMLANTATGSLTEFLQEFGQAMGQDVVAKMVYDESREMDVAKWAKQGAVGAITGGLAGASVQVLQEAGVTAAQPTGTMVDDAQREAAATLVIDALQSRFDKVVGPDENPAYAGISAEEAASAVLNGEIVGPALEDPEGATFEGYVAVDQTAADNAEVLQPVPGEETLADIAPATPPAPVLDRIVEETREWHKNAPQMHKYGPFVANDFVDRLVKTRAPVVAPPPVTRGRGGSVPAVNEEGVVPLTHWSSEARDVLSPEFAGSNPALRGDERNTGFTPGTYFGAYQNRSEEPPAVDEREYMTLSADEKAALAKLRGLGVTASLVRDRLQSAWRAAVSSRGYVKEPGLGPVRHEVGVAPDDLYNVVEDPLRLRPAATPGSVSQQRWMDYEAAIKEAGFKGIYNPRGDNGPMAVMFEATSPTSTVDERDGFRHQFEVTDPRAYALDQADTRPLPGLTTSSGPVPSVVQAARAYAAARGLPARRQAEYVKADPERGARIAAAYDKMKHAPNDPKVKAAYKAMADETLAQYQFVKATGLQVEAIEPGMADPYPGGPKEVLDDLAKGHLWFYPTDQGFGSSDMDVSDNPLLAPTDEWIGGRQLVVNDVFRIVHDFFGHGIEGSGFGARGEENAWQSHMRLYSSAALPAVTSETRGQNSWVNFGPYGEQNRASQRDTVYADQKTGIMPDWTWKEGVADDDTMSDTLARVGDPVDPAKQRALADQIPGLGIIMANMTPAEQARVRKANAQKIIDMVEQLPSAEEMAAVAFSGRAKRGWYRRSAQALLDIFGLEDAPRFSALLAALSPQNSVEQNTINALNVWAAWLRAGRPSDEAGALKAYRAGLAAFGKPLDAWTNNSIEALTNPDTAAIDLSGPKVSSFMANLNDVTHEVTNDAWMTNYAGVTDKFVKGQWTGSKNIKSLGYIAMSTVVRRAAKIASDKTGETWTPAEVQETVWSWAKTLYEKSSNTGTTAEQLLAAGGVTAEDIASTPDFATLFVSGVYRNILEGAGYGVSTDAGNQRDAGRDGGGRNPFSTEGLDVAQPDFTANLQRAARRLDALRATRKSEEGVVSAAEEEVASQLPDHITDDDLDAFAAVGGDAFASTSASRGAYKAEQVRPKQGIATQPGQQSTENADVSLSKITRNLTKLLNLTLRQGRISMSVKDSFGNKMDVMGQYSKGNDVARVRTMNDLSTVVHEAGHKLYFNAGAPLKQFIQQNEKQLMDVATALYGGDTNIMPRATHIAEGFAEFFRIYTMNRAFAARKYGKATTAFDEMLSTSDPALKDGLEVIGQQFAAWLQLPSAQMVANMIVSGKKDDGINAAIAELREAGFSTWFHEKARNAVEQSVNRYAGLDSLINQTLNIGQENRGSAIDLKRSEDPRALIRLASNTGARAQVQLTDGVMGYRSVTSETRGLRDALLLSQGRRLDQQIGKLDPVRQRDFAAYLVALRGIDEYRRFSEGKIERPPVAATLGDLKLTVDEMNGKYPEFAQAATIAHEYAMGLWKKAYDAGLMTKEAYEDSLDRQFYTPLQRDMSDKKSTFGDGPLTGGNKLVKQFRGSDRDILDPMDVLMHKTFALEQNIARNDVMKMMAKLADKAGKAGSLIERVPAQQLIGSQYSVKEIARQLTKDENITEADAADLMTLLEASIKDEKTLALFRQQQAATLGENIVFFWEDGRLAAIQLADGDLGADVVNVVNGLGRENLGLLDAIVNPVAATTTAFRSAVTLWPDFLLVNFIRDQMSAFILTNVGYKPFWTGIKGVGDELRQRSWAKQYNAAMGIMGGMNVSAMHDANVKRDIAALRRKGYVASVFSERTLPGAIRGVARAVELAETGSRLGIFRSAYERAKADGLNDWDASIEASYTATDYMNFGLNGSKMLLARRTIPFLNAQLQGLYKMMRTLGGDEVRQRKGLRFALSAFFKSTKNMDLSRTEKQAVQTGRVAWLKMASLGLISAALHYLFEDDPDYQEAGEYLRTTGWVIPMGEGKLAYIPKPFELALIANFTERAFEYAGGDETAKARFLRGLAMTMTPPTSPPALQSLIEYQANRDFFTGQEIVPSYMQALAPELQFNNYTTAFAKEVGSITGWSPMLIDHFMSSLGASAYKDMTGIYNAFDPNRPSMDASDTMISRRFVRDVRRGSASSKDFWRLASTLNGTMRRAEMSYRRYLEAGNQQAADAYLDTLDEDERAYAILNGNFDVDAKRLNPLYRVRQVNTIVSAMRREMVSELGVDDTTVKNSGETIKLSKREKKDLDLALSEYARREMRNTMIAQGVPGWAGKARMNTETTLNLISTIDPRMREELDRRIRKAKVYSAEIVEEYWPEVKDRLLRDRENTFLKDVITIAKATR